MPGVRAGQHRLGPFPSLHMILLDSADLQRRRLRGARRLQIPGGCEVLQDRLGEQYRAMVELWTWRQETWFLVWALPLTSCVVWGQMLGFSGPQWFVELDCTGHLDDIFFFISSLAHQMFLKLLPTPSLCQVNQAPQPAACWGGRAGVGILQ